MGTDFIEALATVNKAKEKLIKSKQANDIFTEFVMSAKSLSLEETTSLKDIHDEMYDHLKIEADILKDWAKIDNKLKLAKKLTKLAGENGINAIPDDLNIAKYKENFTVFETYHQHVEKQLKKFTKFTEAIPFSDAIEALLPVRDAVLKNKLEGQYLQELEQQGVNASTKNGKLLKKQLRALQAVTQKNKSVLNETLTKNEAHCFENTLRRKIEKNTFNGLLLSPLTLSKYAIAKNNDLNRLKLEALKNR